MHLRIRICWRVVLTSDAYTTDVASAFRTLPTDNGSAVFRLDSEPCSWRQAMRRVEQSLPSSRPAALLTIAGTG